ncbi:hypothetical protein ACLOJK_024381 [Asimina triloba]
MPPLQEEAPSEKKLQGRAWSFSYSKWNVCWNMRLHLFWLKLAVSKQEIESAGVSFIAQIVICKFGIHDRLKPINGSPLKSNGSDELSGRSWQYYRVAKAIPNLTTFNHSGKPSSNQGSEHNRSMDDSKQHTQNSAHGKSWEEYCVDFENL